MAGRSAWVLNLDADLELAKGQGYVPRRSVREAMRLHAEKLAAMLLGPDDDVVDLDALRSRQAGESGPDAAAGESAREGYAFCPTPSALAALERAHAVPVAHPSFEVLRHVNARSFAASLGQTLPGAAFVTDTQAARSMLVSAPPLGSAWRAKRAYGMSGRGQRIITPGLASAADWGFIEVCVNEVGVQIEPNVAIVTEYAIHGMLAEDGTFALGELVRQRCDAAGAWLGTERAREGTVESALQAEATVVAAALAAAGYFGPFGIDAYTYRGEGDALRLQPRSEINARYTMGFAVGFGRRPWATSLTPAMTSDP